MKRSIITIALALAATALVVTAGMSLATAAGGGGGNGTKVLGKRPADLKPFCKKSRERGSCEVVASLTTFISQLGENKRPFVAPSDGRIVAWSIELGHKPSDKPFPDDPDSSNLEFFQDLFGSEKHGNGPVGRLAILKRQGDGVDFKLTDQSPLMDLGGAFYNEDTVITLDRPLPIREGEIVGLSSYTWIPMLKPSEQGDGKTSWRANLARGGCESSDIIDGKPQKKIGSIREYGCQFNERLFYKAWFVPN